MPRAGCRPVSIGYTILHCAFASVEPIPLLVSRPLLDARTQVLEDLVATSSQMTPELFRASVEAIKDAVSELGRGG